MYGRDRLATRLNYMGGISQEKRMIQDKLRSLKKALLYSYQAQTIELADGRHFRCLINPDKETEDYDNKIISIPYEDICLNKPFTGDTTTKGQEEIGMKAGDVFTWLENDTHWIVYLEYLEEKAYFMAEIRKCEQELDIDGRHYWAYIRGPVETKTVWNQKGGIEWNDLNQTVILYISRDEYTVKTLVRHKKIKLKDPKTDELKTWKVTASNPFHGDGVIEVVLLEDYENTPQDIIDSMAAEEPEEQIPETAHIAGPSKLAAFDHATYSLENTDQIGDWYLIKDSIKTSLGQGKEVVVENEYSKGKLQLICETIDEKLTKDIEITSF